VSWRTVPTINGTPLAMATSTDADEAAPDCLITS